MLCIYLVCVCVCDVVNIKKTPKTRIEPGRFRYSVLILPHLKYRGLVTVNVL